MGRDNAIHGLQGCSTTGERCQICRRRGAAEAEDRKPDSAPYAGFERNGTYAPDSVLHAPEIDHRPRRLMLERLAIGRTAEDFQILRAVKTKIFPRRVRRNIARTHDKPRDCNPPLHMLTIVPAIEIFFIIWFYIGPYEKCSGCFD